MCRADDYDVALGMDLPFLTPETFPLPAELGHRLRDISHKVHHGMGFAVLRGLDPKQYDDEENVIAYCGLASYVGLERVTNAFGMSMSMSLKQTFLPVKSIELSCNLMRVQTIFAMPNETRDRKTEKTGN